MDGRKSLNKDGIVSPAEVREPRRVVGALLREATGGGCLYEEPVFCVTGRGCVSSRSNVV